MNVVKRIGKLVLFIILIPLTYLVVSLLLSALTVDKKEASVPSHSSIYLSSNGVHLDIVLEKKDINTLVLSGLKHTAGDKFMSFGWGDENFYLNTPTWGDLTFNNGFKALFLKSATLMHITRFKEKQINWIEIKVSHNELIKLNSYLEKSFLKDNTGSKTLIAYKGYGSNDDFYKANGSYSCFKTCNSWVNTGFVEGGMKACFWTPFDFGLLHKYE
ncbi:DUF2459 domain-containing protein [Cellulophaga sp. E16_2]|uniref:DUF2459 domain-containing protein n=1 Tax=Cellulophaga algicola (strain DSM 14237 / IC166 / ACAM 630) TaxID=688270 RepID=E6XDT6_CELAD|nr:MULTISPECIES: DUF2459 domain-containing protein [Cellulophaga]ADV51274.1 Conserved hypothetical protein CHP02117 [Cellulophaga algicola DSM 14237]MBO0593660.1 DUF2459 domain-containing protein [Cellulophaga sp. E16_2]